MSESMNMEDEYVSNQQLDLLNACTQKETLEEVEHPAWVSITSFSESCGSHLSRISSLCLDEREYENNNHQEDMNDRKVPDDFQNKDSTKDMPYSNVMEHTLHKHDAHNFYSHGFECNIAHENKYNDRGIEQSCSEVAESNFLLDEEQVSMKLKRSSYPFIKDETPFSTSGSLQSLASSSKTVYASPRSNSGDHFYCSERQPSATSTINRKGPNYRVRAPSENSLDFSNLRLMRQSKLSHSLHDVASIPSNGLKNPTRKSAGASLSTLNLRNRSRDSGFVQSGSLLSLSSGSRNYDHVESKVKRYIQNIKDADALRRKERAQAKGIVTQEEKSFLGYDYSEPQDGPEMVLLVQKLQQDLEEKDRLLSQLQDEYSSLLGKYAQAENKIDRLRFGWEQPPPLLSRVTDSSEVLLLNGSMQGSPHSESENCSFSSSMFLSNIEGCASPDLSNFMKGDGQRNNAEKIKREVVLSAPLRPISSLYCSSVRLDKIMTPLISKSSDDLPSTSSSLRQSSVFLESKKKSVDLKLTGNTTRNETVDTGAGSDCPMLTNNSTLNSNQANAVPIQNLPYEDPILKVQRWQKSLSPTRSHKTLFPPVKSRRHMSEGSFNERTGHARRLSVEPLQKKKNYSSIGIQVNNEGIGNQDISSLPSSTSRLSGPIVPCLNLDELSGSTDESYESTLVSDCEKNDTTSSDQVQRLELNSGLGCCVPLGGTSHGGPPSSMKHLCEARCKVCGSHVKWCQKTALTLQSKPENIKLDVVENSDSLHNCQTVKDSKRTGKVQKSISQLSGPELAKLISLIWHDQDQMVPTSPEEEKAFQHAFKTLERKMKSVNLQTFVSLLDDMLEREPAKKDICECNIPNKQHEFEASTPCAGLADPPVDSEVDSSLLQCLEEIDEYTHQVWAKTESLLEALNSTKLKVSKRNE